MCFLEPIVDIYDGDTLKKRLVRVKESDAQIIADAVESGDLSPLDSLEITAQDKSFLDKQTRIALRNCGIVDPTDINDYIKRDGYKAIKRALVMTPEAVIEEIKASGLAGRGGLVEVPMGMTIRDVIYDIGGGIRGDRQCKAVQLGGPSGGCVPFDKFDTVIDYKELAATGAIMGSGGMVVMDDTTCMVGMAKFFLDFTAKESCGKCVHCRIGTKRLLEILTRITKGDGKPGDIELLEELCGGVKDGALCGLGQTAPNPVLSTIRYFRDEYEAHINEKRCPVGECRELLTYSIDKDECRGCTLCAKKCPAGAISGTLKSPHEIDRDVCIKCGQCVTLCRFGAIKVR